MIYLACSLCELSCFSAPLLLLKQAERKIQCRMLNWWVRLVFTAFRGSNLSQTFIASTFVTRPDIEYTMTCTQVNIMNLIIIYTPVIIFVCNVGVVNRVLPDHLILPGRKRWSLIGRGKFLAPEEKGRHQPHQLWPHGFLGKKGYYPPTRTHVFSLKPDREGLALWANLQ